VHRRRARRHQVQIDVGMPALECGPSWNEPTPREGRKRRDPQSLLEAPFADGGRRQPVQRRFRLVPPRCPRLRCKGLAARAQEQLNTRPILQRTELPTDRAVGEAELARGLRAARRAAAASKALIALRDGS
jgi:hypothetical protein